MRTRLLAIAILAIFGGLVALVSCQREAEHPPAPNDAQPGADAGPAAVETMTAALYFPGFGNRLKVERRELPANGDAAERIATVVEALLAGPQSSGMGAPLPDSVSLRKVYLADGTIFLDLESAEGASPPASGSLREMLAVYSLVNTVLLNFEEAETLVLLWNGRQLRTFAGHLDTTRPLTANLDLILTSTDP